MVTVGFRRDPNQPPQLKLDRRLGSLAELLVHDLVELVAVSSTIVADAL